MSSQRKHLSQKKPEKKSSLFSSTSNFVLKKKKFHHRHPHRKKETFPASKPQALQSSRQRRTIFLSFCWFRATTTTTKTTFLQSLSVMARRGLLVNRAPEKILSIPNRKPFYHRTVVVLMGPERTVGRSRSLGVHFADVMLIRETGDDDDGRQRTMSPCQPDRHKLSQCIPFRRCPIFPPLV